MTEKRFKNNGTLIFDNKTPLNTFEVVDKLNALHEENEQLKQKLKSIFELTKKIEDYTYDIKLIGDDVDD